MDEFEKIRAFSEEMSRQTEQAAAQEKAEVEGFGKSAPNVPFDEIKSPENPNFLEEWTNEQKTETTAEKSLSKTFWIVLGLTTLVLIGLVIVFWLLLKAPMEKGEVVTIPPTPSPVKVKPENPGGIVIPDQDKEIYTRLSKTENAVKVEHLFDEEEEKPVLPPVVENEPESAEDIIVEVTTEPVVGVVPEAKTEEVKKEEVKTETVKQEAKTTPKNVTSKAKATQKEKKKVAPAGKWQVQLFSSSDKAKVEATWKTISVKYKNLLSDMPMNIEKADISGKGTFYRLKVGAFSTKTRAANLCAKLKKQKQECFPVK